MKWRITFSESQWEYTGTLIVEGETLEKINDCTFKVNGATIEIDEEIGKIDLIDVDDMVFDRTILRCARVTACPNCEGKGVISNMTRNDLDVFECKTCGMEIDLNKLEECTL